MEHQRILDLLNKANYYKFVTRKWTIVNDQSNANYILKVSKSNLYDFNDTYILVKVDITVTAALKILHHLLNVSQKLMEQQ